MLRVITKVKVPIAIMQKHVFIIKIWRECESAMLKHFSMASTLMEFRFSVSVNRLVRSDIQTFTLPHLINNHHRDGD